jgi:hypothetical protein
MAKARKVARNDAMIWALSTYATFSHNFVREIASDIVDYTIRHSTIVPINLTHAC